MKPTESVVDWPTICEIMVANEIALALQHIHISHLQALSDFHEKSCFESLLMDSIFARFFYY
jgi:hypothetical protein